MSEVARLRQQIELECEAMKQGMNGLAITAQHQIIQNKYNALGQTQEELAALIGEPDALKIVVETYIKVLG